MIPETDDGQEWPSYGRKEDDGQEWPSYMPPVILYVGSGESKRTWRVGSSRPVGCAINP
jgi:hypothetical protein